MKQLIRYGSHFVGVINLLLNNGFPYLSYNGKKFDFIHFKDNGFFATNSPEIPVFEKKINVSATDGYLVIKNKIEGYPVKLISSREFPYYLKTTEQFLQSCKDLKEIPVLISFWDGSVKHYDSESGIIYVTGLETITKYVLEEWKENNPFQQETLFKF